MNPDINFTHLLQIFIHCDAAICDDNKQSDGLCYRRCPSSPENVNELSSVKSSEFPLIQFLNGILWLMLTDLQYRQQTLDKGPRGESKGSGGVFQGTPAGSQFQHQVEAGKKTKEAPQCYRLNTSQSWEVTLGVIGQHWECSTGQGWEREVSGRGFSYGGTHTGPKWWTIDVYSSTWGRGGISARGFKQRCTKTINRHGTHTHTHTHRRTCLQCNVSL